jgi:two-component system response regulator DesR
MITCIIVDDELQSIERLESLLFGFPEIRILTKEHIPELAVSEIVRHRPDLVFIDVEMPRMSGFDVVHEVRSRNCHPVFIFATAFNQYAIKAIKEGVFDYILKPFDVDELKEAIERYKDQGTRTKDEGRKTREEVKMTSVYLSDREKEVLRLIMQGKTSKEIAGELFISKTTVDSHRRNILEKTGARNSTELISLALEKGWV